MQQTGCTTARVVASHRSVARMQFTEPDAVVSGFGPRDRLFSGAQLFVAIHHELDGGLIRRVEFLSNVCEHEL